MKKVIFFFVFLSVLSTALPVCSQVREQYALATRMYYFNSGGLTGQGNEVLSPLADSSCSGYSGSMKYQEQFEGVFYQVYSTTKVEEGLNRTAFRKSSDGINWSAFVRAGDAPAGKNEYYQNIYVWRKNGNVNVGVIFADSRSTNDQVRFAVSTNGGNTFQPSVQVSTHADNSYIYLGGITGKGDTIVATWSRAVGNITNFSRSTDGGLTWSTTATAYTGGFYNIFNDAMLDNSANLYVVTADDQFVKVNLTVRKSSNLGATWTTMQQITSVTANQINSMPQCRFLNNKLYTIWERNFNNNSIGNWSDGMFLAESSNGGTSWSTPNIVSDTDTLYRSSINLPYIMHPSFTITPSGTIYAVWSDSRAGHSNVFDSCKFNVRLSRSTNNGATWSPTILVNTPSNYSRTYSGYSCVSVRSSGGVDSVLVTWSKLRNTIVSGISQINSEIPSAYSLSQNYPNPFNPVTNIDFQVPVTSNVNVVIFDMLGREVEQLVNNELKAGTYRVDWNSGSNPSGIYFYRITAGKFTQTKKMILIK